MPALFDAGTLNEKNEISVAFLPPRGISDVFFDADTNAIESLKSP